MKRIILVYILVLFTAESSFGQLQVKGVVYDSIGVNPVQSVSVLTSSGKGAVTNSKGEYVISVTAVDSIWFSYLNKPTRKFPVKDIANPFAFDISIKVNITTLPIVVARQRSYKLDSIENRDIYAKVFDYERPGLSTTTGGYGGAAGFDLNEIINVFRFGYNRRMQAFQRRLITEEQDKFIKHRFSKALIRRLTTLTEDSLINDFIETYQPTFLFAKRADEYTFQKYIKDSYERYSKGLLPPYLWREGLTTKDDFIQ